MDLSSSESTIVVLLARSSSGVLCYWKSRKNNSRDSLSHQINRVSIALISIETLSFREILEVIVLRFGT